MMQKIAERPPHHYDVSAQAGSVIRGRPCSQPIKCQASSAPLSYPHFGPRTACVVFGRHDALAPLTRWCSDSTSWFVAIAIAITVQDPPQRHFGTPDLQYVGAERPHPIRPLNGQRREAGFAHVRSSSPLWLERCELVQPSPDRPDTEPQNNQSR